MIAQGHVKEGITAVAIKVGFVVVGARRHAARGMVNEMLHTRLEPGLERVVSSQSLWDSIVSFESCVEEAIFTLRIDALWGKVVVVVDVAAPAFALVAAEAEICIAVVHLDVDAFRG